MAWKKTQFLRVKPKLLCHFAPIYIDTNFQSVVTLKGVEAGSSCYYPIMFLDVYEYKKEKKCKKFQYYFRHVLMESANFNGCLADFLRISMSPLPMPIVYRGTLVFSSYGDYNILDISLILIK